jgi:type II secretory pathway component PulM
MGRGFVTALLLVLIALACITVARRIERERRLIAKLRARDAYDAGSALDAGQLDADERDTAADLAQAGVLRSGGNAHYLDLDTLAIFRRKRVRFAVSGALVALAVAVLVAVLILGR